MKTKISNITLYSILCLFTLYMGGCELDHDFLERAPSDLIDENKVFSNLENAQAFLNNAYRGIPSLTYRNTNNKSQFNLGSGTDESAHMWWSDNSTLNINNGNWNAVSFPLDWAWFGYYSSIRRINLFMKNYDKIPEEVNGTVLSERKKRLLGEAYGLRAYYYFLLYTMWGEIPIIKSPLYPSGDDNIKIPRSPLKDVIASIDDDIQHAIEILPPRHDDANFGRFTSVAAWALRSRLYLYYASELSNPQNEKSRWEKAATTAKQAIDFAESYGYQLSLSDNNGKKAYERIFQEMNNPEVIFSSTTSYGYWNFWAGSLATGGWYGEGPIQELVDDYEMLNGEIPVLGYNSDNTQIINTKAGYNPSKPYEGRDNRFYQTILYHGAMWKGRKVDISPKGLDYSADRPRVNYFWKKYCIEEFNLFTEAGKRPQRFVNFRLSELYLNYAEAQNEFLSQPDATVTNVLNIIRQRAGLPNILPTISQKEMRDKIRHERRIEFAMENQRFWDVRRWKIAEIVDNKSVHKVEVNKKGIFVYPEWSIRVFDKNKHYLFPIPQSEIDKNRDILKQNPGWQ